MAASIDPLGQDDGQLAARELGARMADLESSAQAHGACKAAEASFQKMEAGFGHGCGRGFLARHDKDVASEQNANRFEGNAGDVDHDFYCRRGLDYVESRMVLAGIRPLLGGESRGQIGENLAEVIEQFPRVGRGKKRELEHRASMMSQRGRGRRDHGPGRWSWVRTWGLTLSRSAFMAVLWVKRSTGLI